MTAWYLPAATLGTDLMPTTRSTTRDATFGLPADPRVPMTSAQGVV